MKTSYFTFGQIHEGWVNGKYFNKNTVVKITAEEPRTKMVELFGLKWAFEYDELPAYFKEHNAEVIDVSDYSTPIVDPNQHIKDLIEIQPEGIQEKLKNWNGLGIQRKIILTEVCKINFEEGEWVESKSELIDSETEDYVMVNNEYIPLEMPEVTQYE